jgi:poly(ADP-ribose)glycohydrolase PARG
MENLLRRSFDAAALVAAHPPVLRHPHKRLVHELAASGPAPTGTIELTRWAAGSVPTAPLHPTELVAAAGYYDYAGGDAATWHVNFADPQLFVAYGSPLLAQDELQVAEHPALGSVREALIAADSEHAFTDAGAPTPVLVTGVERRCVLATAPDAAAGRPFGLYGNRFAMAPQDQIRAAVTLVRPPTHTHFIAIAAPVGRGEYMRAQLDQILATAYTGFAAAVAESARLWPGASVEIRTGFWGCGAFGGNRLVMTSLQLYAARLAGIARVQFYAFDDAGLADLRAGAAVLADAIAAGGDIVERIADRDFRWGIGDGN